VSDRSPGQGRTPRLIVGIPSAGRAAILGPCLQAMADQTRRPDLVLLSVTGPADLPPGRSLPFPVRVLVGPRGGAPQRNRILEALSPDDLLVLLDDDFLMAPDYLAQVERLFRTHPDIALITGTVLADGILGPGYDVATGARLLRDGLRRPAGAELIPVHTGYGCNMALRAAPVVRQGLRFDEALPLYSWLEDVDFSHRLAASGRLVRAEALRGVHLGTKTGRTPGLLLGYSQIANPLYLRRKGTIGRRHAATLLCRALASNGLRTLRPPPWADYRGRLRGNLLALGDVLRRRDRPGRILTLAQPDPPAAAPAGPDTAQAVPRATPRA